MAPWSKEFAISRYTNDSIQKGEFQYTHMPEKTIPAEKLAKLGNASEHEKFRSQILGLSLLAASRLKKRRCKQFNTSSR